jgi:hypothetical protein
MSKMICLGLLLIILFVEIPFGGFQQYRFYVQVSKDRTISYWASYKNVWGMLSLWSKLIWFKLMDTNNKIYCMGKEATDE